MCCGSGPVTGFRPLPEADLADGQFVLPVAVVFSHSVLRTLIRITLRGGYRPTVHPTIPHLSRSAHLVENYEGLLPMQQIQPLSCSSNTCTSE